MLQCKNLIEVSLTEERFLHKQTSMANAYRKAEDVRVSQNNNYEMAFNQRTQLTKGIGLRAG